jgi:hypothetical protein
VRLPYWDTRSRLFSPEIGGINFGAGYDPVARPDHDQGFQQTTNIQYQFADNPSRIAPRNLLDVALGSEEIWKKEPFSVGAKLTVVNLTDKVALYNFLSSFSGTHFVTPRSIHGEITFHF